MIVGIMNGERYRDILEEHVYTSVQQLDLGGDWTLQQDNDPEHAAKLTSLWLTVNNVELLQWSSQSSDFNPIDKCVENLENED